MKAVVVVFVVFVASCASTPEVRAVVEPCARARLAREFPAEPTITGCYGVVEGPRELQRAQIVLLTSIAVEVLADEPPRYRLATLQPFVPATAPSWGHLSATHARLIWMNGPTGVELCLRSDGPRLQGHVVVVTDYAPFLHVAGPVTLQQQPCPS